MSDIQADYSAAARRERELSPRQIGVLQMIADGKTNPEIAAALEITLDGAKWNVSEILSKLGLRTREEAAEYWRRRQQRQRRLARLARGFATLPVLKWGLAAAGTAAVVAGGLMAWGALRSDHRASADVVPFSLEASVTVRGSDAPAADGLPSFENRSSTSTIRWSVQDGSHWRWDVTTTDLTFQTSRTTVAAADGSVQRTYDDASNSYNEAPFRPLPDGLLIGPSMAAMVGPVPGGTIDGFIRALSETRSAEWQVAVVGEEEILGRRTVILEIGPTSTGTDSQGNVTRSGTMRAWVDPARMFVMRSASSQPEQSFQMEVTRLEYDRTPNDAAVAFSPPAGAVNRGASSYQSSSGGGSVSPGNREVGLPHGFLVPAYIPEGFLQVRESSEREGPDRASTDPFLNDPTSAEAVIAGPEGTAPRAYIRLQERRRPGDPPAPPAGSAPANINGNIGALSYQPESDTTTLIWAQDGLLIVVSSRGIAADDLVRVARSMQLSSRPSASQMPLSPTPYYGSIGTPAPTRP